MLYGRQCLIIQVGWIEDHCSTPAVKITGPVCLFWGWPKFVLHLADGKFGVLNRLHLVQLKVLGVFCLFVCFFR